MIQFTLILIMLAYILLLQLLRLLLGVEPPTKFSKRRGLDRIPIFRGGLLGKGGGVTFFRGCSFYIKDKLKSEILKYVTTKKVYKNVFV